MTSSTRRKGAKAPRLLIVDHDRPTRVGYAAYFRLEGFAVDEADSATEAFDGILGHTPDVILLDVRLPDGDGWELCRELNRDERTREIPIVVMTASDGPPRAPCDAVLLKPVRPRLVVRRVSEALHHAELTR
jgi:CheY-like chemotaxis protein